MAKRKVKRKRKTRRSSQSVPMPGWIWGIFGLTVGLSVAAAVYVKDREPQAVRATTAHSEPVSNPAAVAKPGVAEKTEPRFRFYDMLPNFEVVISEEDTVISNNSQPVPLDTGGIYVLQAGSFSSHADADRRKAQLAMMGIASRIQKVSVDDKEYHRIRIGPVDNLDQLNRLRTQLHNAEVDVMVIRVGD